ncbi:MAG: phosphatase PAP2 family protein [Bryobacterales bacterium]|nr:phosphatase PAP2 family protein [Bryobacterales bacterium]
MLSYIESRDMRIMKRVHRWKAPAWVRQWMICATRGGDGWLWYVVCAAILVFGGAEGYHAVCESSMAAAVGIFLFLWLKRATGRKRPCAIEPHCWASLLPPDQFSFPSGHTITAFAVAVPLMLHFPELGAALLFCALSIALSRVMLGMHFLSDVMAGALLGIVLGYGAHALVVR